MGEAGRQIALTIAAGLRTETASHRRAFLM
jgi:hypothetical protein